LRVLVAVTVLVIACAIAGLLVVRSGWFRERVRERVINEIESAAGGRVEIGSFRFSAKRLEATVSPLVLHGTEPAGDPPLLRVQSIAIGLRVISALERKVDLSYLRLEQPLVRVVVYPDGSTNIPAPRLRQPSGSWAEDLINLAVRRYEITAGLFEYDNRRIPINLRGEDLRLQTVYEARGPRYRGDIQSHRARIIAGGLGPLELDLAASFALEKSRIDFSRLRLATKESRFDLSGALEDVRAPHGTFNTKGAISVREAVSLFGLPIAPKGTAAFDGRMSVSFAKGFDYSLSGRATARGITYSYDRLKIDDGEARADLRLAPGKVTLRGITATALGSALTGQADLDFDRRFHFEGNLEGLGVREAARIATDRPIAWSGTMAAGLMVDATLGQPTARVHANVGITPSGEGTPLEGRLDVSYDQENQAVQLGDSYLATASTRVELSGTLGQTMRVRAQSSNLDDVLPALDLVMTGAPKELPLKLSNGQVTLSGSVSGRLGDPHFIGQTSVTSASLEGHAFDRFSSEADLSRRSILLRRLTLARGPTTIEGQADLAPRDGKFDDAAISAALTIKNAQLAELAKQAGAPVVMTGSAAATVRLSGTLQRPEAEIAALVDKPAAFGEQADRLRASLRYSANAIEVTQGEADAGPAKVLFQGAYQRRGDDWKNGEARFDVAAQDLQTSRIQTFKKLQPQFDARVDGKAAGAAHIRNGELSLVSLNGDASVRGVTFNGEGFGDLSLTAATQGAELGLTATAQVREVKIHGQGVWPLEGDRPGSATIRFPRLSVEALHNLIMIGGTAEQKSAAPPFEGYLEGSATLAVSLRKLQDFQADVTLDTVQLNPKPSQTPRLGVQAQDLVVKNTQPVVIAVSAKEARIRSAQFTARETNLEVSGAVPFDARTGADFAVRGSVNLNLLQLLNPDLLARGNASVQASVRGSLRDPQLNGRMELKNASLYLNDLPNGVDNANGVVQFDRNRATIEKLTAETGGGTISFGGFLEFGAPTLVYRLQAEANQVRVRYPEDVSMTFTARLGLNGTSDSSTVSGVLTLNRAAFNPRADLGQLLAQSVKPVPAPAATSDYLRGMQFDVRIESGPNFEFQTSLTRDVQAEVDLRLRGTPLRPALLGTISVNQGEIQIFGNRYTVNRGDIRFLNPVKIEPAFDMDLETRARGITVNVALSGTMQKLNVNYSSDPPMQSREIIALLAVGRNPSGPVGLGSSQATGSSSAIEAGGGLLGEAVSAQLSNRLQRFFGASRVKIDPTLTGVENVPQARLTLEQQVSKDITLTYITNLNRTQEQIVQLRWDLSRQWSAIAVRDSNGMFGIDFQFRKRFK
jgi:translocation and assembly module TamB